VAQPLELAAVDRLHQRLTRGEVPVERADADARLARDRLQRGGPLGSGELGQGDVEEAATVAFGVGTWNRRVLRFW